MADDLGNAFTANLAAALGLHRAWDRAASVMASAVPLPADPRGQATPSGRSDRESVKRLTISARLGGTSRSRCVISRVAGIPSTTDRPLNFFFFFFFFKKKKKKKKKKIFER